MKEKLAAIIAINLALVCTFAVFETADAKELTAGSVASTYPVVSEVVKEGNGYVAFVETKAKSAAIKVIDRKSGKKVRCDRLGVHTWACKLKANRDYKIVAKAKGAKAKSIGYRVYR